MRYAHAVGCSAAASDVEPRAKEIAFLGQASKLRWRKAPAVGDRAVHQSAQINPV